MQFTKAERKKAKLRLGLTGVSGSGKTYSALLIASGIGGRIAVIDTEHGSASLYANEFDFDVLELEAPFEPERYIQAITSAEQAGYDVLIIDSISHEWNGAGGCLQINDAFAKNVMKGNSFMAWSHTTPRHQAFIEKIISSKIHIIATMRSKTEYAQEGKQILKVATKSEQRDGIEYEFTTILDLNHSTHEAVKSKDRTKLFPAETPFKVDANVGKAMIDWLNTGADFYMSQENQVILNELLKKLPSDSDIVTKIKDKYPSFAEVENSKFDFIEKWLGQQIEIHKQHQPQPAEQVVGTQEQASTPEKAELNINHQSVVDEITKAISVMTLEDFAEVDFFIEQRKPELSEANYSVLKAAFNQKYSELESEINA